ncbi:MAG: GNAT family N-acetyltransferase [Myxococcales bacterium]|nr:GNAT family N-acetyltransferase [Myxococcales bacterium]
MSLRPATRDDVPALVTLVTEVLAEFGLAFGQGSKTDEQLLALPESMTDDGGAFWVVEDDGGALLGCGGVARIDDETFEIRKMYLHRAARGRGFGKRLLDTCEAHARSVGARRLVLDTISEMAGAIRLYEGAGFVRDDAQIRGSRCSRGYRKDLT